MTEYPDQFETLWSKFPARDGKKTKKLPAFKKWKILTSDQKAALFSSVEKHNRNGTWGKYIRDLVTYINQAGWEDVIQDPKVTSNKNYHLAEKPYECSKWQALANRWMLRWLQAAGGLPDESLPMAVKIKTDTVTEMSAALDEEIGADPSREVQTEAIWTFLNVLIDRLDHDFRRNLKPLLLKG